MTDQPQPLAERIAAALTGHTANISNGDGTVICNCGTTVGGNPVAWRAHRADTVLAVVQPDLDARVVEIRRLTAELAPYDALQLGHPDGRISTTCTAGKHPTWLRYPDDTRYYACPWCESDRLTVELEAEAAQKLRIAAQAVAEEKRLAAELEQARQQLVGIATVRVWKNEDGIEFLYAADVRAAINGETTESDCGCKTAVHPGHYPSCTAPAAVSGA